MENPQPDEFPPIDDPTPIPVGEPEPFDPDDPDIG